MTTDFEEEYERFLFRMNHKTPKEIWEEKTFSEKLDAWMPVIWVFLFLFFAILGGAR